MTPLALPLNAPADVQLALLVQRLAKHHCGRERGIKGTDLARDVGVHERTLRTLISRAREEGIAIVGTPDTGYYIAENDGELNDCCKFLRTRAMHSLMIEARLRRVALPDLLGQLHLKT